MRVIGITGPTGAGKSVVCKRLGDWDRITVIDCDRVARDVVRRGEHCLLDLAVEFSSAIVTKDGELDRRRLAGIVFRDRKKLRRMEGIMFPYILDRIRAETARREAAGDRAVFLDAPTLYQSGADALCEKVIAVLAPEGDRLRRIMERDGLTEEEARARMANQPGDEFFEKRADYVIRNTKETSALRLEILELMNKLGL